MSQHKKNPPALVKLSSALLLESREAELSKSSNSVRMTDSVQNLLRGLRLKSENTEEEAVRPILRDCVPGVVGSAASGDGTCSARRAKQWHQETDRKGAKCSDLTRNLGSRETRVPERAAAEARKRIRKGGSAAGWDSSRQPGCRRHDGGCERRTGRQGERRSYTGVCMRESDPVNSWNNPFFRVWSTKCPPQNCSCFCHLGTDKWVPPVRLHLN
jgi:hypothetical protein